MVKRSGIKYAPRPYEDHVTVLERVEYFNHWFYATHQKKGAVAIKLSIGNNKLIPDDRLLKEMGELCK